MAKKSMGAMPGMDMGGMDMGGSSESSKNTDPTKNQQGIDTPPPTPRAPGSLMEEGMKNMPMIAAPRVWTVTGTEDWKMLRGFGAAAPMVDMMNEMMVAGSPMGAMKMGNMNYSMTEIPAPMPEEARTAAQVQPPPPAQQEPPAQAQPAAPTGPLKVTAVIATASPAVGKGNLMTVTVTDDSGKPINDATVTSTVAMVTMDMGTTHPAFKSIGAGKYQGSVVFAMGGPWKVELRIAAPGQAPIMKSIVYNAK